MCGVLDADRADDRPAHPRLPRGGRGRLLGARARRDRGPRARVPPHHRGPAGTRRPRRGRSAAEKRASCRAGVHASYLHLHWAGVPGRWRGGSWQAAGMTAPTLTGVGMGPGDPELVTVKAVRVLREADLVLCRSWPPARPAGPRRRCGSHAGRAEARGATPADRRGWCSRWTEGAGLAEREAAWDGAADAAVAAFAGGALGGRVRHDRRPERLLDLHLPRGRPSGRGCPALDVATVPGITAMQDLAARSGTVLCEGREPLALLPLTAGLVPFTRRRSRGSTRSSATRAAATCPRCSPRSATRAGSTARCTGPASACPARTSGPRPRSPAPAPYLSTLIVPGRRTRRGGKL